MDARYINFDLIRSDISNIEAQAAEVQNSIEARVSEFRSNLENEVANQLAELNNRRTELAGLLPVEADAEVIEGVEITV